MIITLIGERTAREGYEFVYLGPLPECRECKLKTVCFNLDEGSKYRVTGIRDKTHDCRIHEDGVRVVEVEKVPICAAIEARLAHEGSMLTYARRECDEVGCENYRLCVPLAAKDGNKYRIVTIKGKLECPRGDRLVSVILD